MSLTHNTFRAFSLTMLVFGLAPSVGFADPPVTWKRNGAYINLNTYDGSCIDMSIYVSRGGTTKAPETYLHYFAWDGCAGQTFAAGQGLIPNTSFKLAKGVATLVFTPNNSATFFAEGALAAIKVTVTPDGVYSASVSEHNEYTYPGYVMRTHGSGTHKSARASGTTMVGTFESSDAQVGTLRDHFMELQRLSK
jgi:hypothetical protein